MTAGVRTVIRAQEFASDAAAERLNRILMAIYLRLEALEKGAAKNSTTNGYGPPGVVGSVAPGGSVTWVASRFTTSAAVESTFPVTVVLPLSVNVVTGCTCIKVFDVATPGNIFYTPPAVDWAAGDGSRGYGAHGLRLNYVSGLEPSRAYDLTLEVRYV